MFAMGQERIEFLVRDLRTISSTKNSDQVHRTPVALTPSLIPSTTPSITYRGSSPAVPP
jgi:hypothetical protein